MSGDPNIGPRKIIPFAQDRHVGHLLARVSETIAQVERRGMAAYAEPIERADGFTAARRVDRDRSPRPPRGTGRAPTRHHRSTYFRPVPAQPQPRKRRSAM